METHVNACTQSPASATTMALPAARPGYWARGPSSGCTLRRSRSGRKRGGACPSGRRRVRCPPHLLGCTLPSSGSGRKRGGGGDWTRRCLLSSTSSSPSPPPEAAVGSFGADEAHLQGRLHTAVAGVAGSCGVTASRRGDRKLLWQELAGEVLDELVRVCTADMLCVPPQPLLDTAAGSGCMRTQASFSPTTRRFPLPPPTQLDEAPAGLTSRWLASSGMRRRGIELDILDGDSNKAIAEHAAKDRQQEPLEQTPRS